MSSDLDDDDAPVRKVRRYRCPFCDTKRAPVWRKFWGPVGTLTIAFILAVIIACFVVAEAAATIVAIVLILGAILAIPHMKERRRVCPECDARLN